MDFRYKSLLEPVHQRAADAPERPVLRYIAGKDSHTAISAERFRRDMLSAAAALQAAGIEKGDVVVLVLRQSWDLVAAIYGAMALGAIPSVFTYLSARLNLKSYLQRVRQLVEQADARVVVTLPDHVVQMDGVLAELDCRALSISALSCAANEPDRQVELPAIAADDIALLQYSSGTTGLQKGVIFTHRKVLEQIRALSGPSSMDMSAEDVIVTWLPLHHDMGLIANLLCSVVADVPLVMMSPMMWMRRPILMLEAIEKYNGSIVTMPNFGFNHMARMIRAEALANLRLERLRLMISGGEPARQDTFEDFYQRFKGCGVRREIFMVGYGMAEAVCGISCTPAGVVPRVDWIDTAAMQNEGRSVPAEPDGPGSLSVVSCGRLFPGLVAKIVDDHGEPLGERQIGELVVKGDFVFDGYYRRPELTDEVLKDGWLHTGDHGYMADGELYICGRKKDMMIVGGKNVFPGDIEVIANEVEGIRKGRVVAFGIVDDVKQTEAVVLVCELARKLSEPEQKPIEKELRQRIGETLDIALFDVRFVGKGWVLKSSSGKLARNGNRQKYLVQFQGVAE